MDLKNIGLQKFTYTNTSEILVSDNSRFTCAFGATEYGSEDLYGVDFSPYLSCDDDLDLFDNENSDSEDSILEDDFLFGI